MLVFFAGFHNTYCFEFPESTFFSTFDLLRSFFLARPGFFTPNPIFFDHAGGWAAILWPRVGDLHII